MRCLICGSRNTEKPFSESAAIARCRECGFGWTTAAVIDESLYEGEYINEAYGPSYFARSGQWRHEARRRLDWILESYTPTRVLEVGSAGGYFVQAALRRGIRAKGVEPSRAAAAYSQQVLGIDVEKSFFEEFDDREGFDCVCAFHVLEHVADPRRFLADARRLLTPHGYLALEVPNFDSSRARREGAGWELLAPRYHRWQFTPESLSLLVEQEGLRVVDRRTASRSGYLRLRDMHTRYALGVIQRDVLSRPFKNLRSSSGEFIRILAVS